MIEMSQVRQDVDTVRIQPAGGSQLSEPDFQRIQMWREPKCEEDRCQRVALVQAVSGRQAVASACLVPEQVRGATVRKGPRTCSEL